MKQILLTLAFMLCMGDLRAQICPAPNGDTCIWIIEKAKPASKGTTILRNGATVKVKVTGTTPFDVCDLKKDRSEIAPDKDAFAGFLDALSKFGGALTFGAEGAKASPPTTIVLTEEKASAGAKQFAELFERAITEARAVNNELVLFRKSLDAFQTTANEFHDEPGNGAAGPTEEDYREAFDKTRRSIAAQIVKLQQNRPVSDLFKRYIADIEKLRGSGEFHALSPAQKDEVDTNLKYVYGRQTEIQVLLAQADDAIKGAVDYGRKLSGLENEFEKSFSAYSDADAKDKLSVSCKDGISGKVTMDTIYATVEFHGRSRLTLSLGLLGSTLDSVQIGKMDISDGQGKSKTMFAEIDHKKSQVIPFSFLNWRIPGLDGFRVRHWPAGINLTAGFGVNPNTGSKEPEFFAGGAVGVGSVLLYLGAHIGRIQSLGGGFNLGDVVPAGISVPVNKSYQASFGFGISYQLPIP
jgi:hypothetical protein